MAKLFANSADPDQTPHSAASDLGLHCLLINLLRVSGLQWVKIAGWVHEKQCRSWWDVVFCDILNWVYTVCPGLSVPILRDIMVSPYLSWLFGQIAICCSDLKACINPFYSLMVYLKKGANNINPDLMPHSAASILSVQFHHENMPI